jgi:sugar phosphate isomerase/epimerase
MKFAISTRWNASRHENGETLVEEILEAGADQIELGYDTRVELLPGITAALDQGRISVSSLHNYCPVPLGVLKGHPELWTFASPQTKTHELAVQHTLRTMQFAAEIGAGIIVIHCGYASFRGVGTGDLMDLIDRDMQNSDSYERKFNKLLKKRAKAQKKPLDQIRRALDYLLPLAETLGVQLGLENLPTLEAVPDETEIALLLEEFPTPFLRYWHDIGHAQIRENLGYLDHLHTLERLGPALGGMHLHDVADQLQDHVMPPDGELGLERYKPFIKPDIPLVVEPSPRATFEEVSTGLAWIRHWWDEGPRPEKRSEDRGQNLEK